MLMANQGTSQTIVFQNGVERTNNLQWSADYDGKVATLDVVSDVNGDTKRYSMKLDNADLEQLLSVPSVPVPLHQRLAKDFGVQSRVRLVGLPRTRRNRYRTPTPAAPRKRTTKRRKPTKKRRKRTPSWSTIL